MLPDARFEGEPPGRAYLPAKVLKFLGHRAGFGQALGEAKLSGVQARIEEQIRWALGTCQRLSPAACGRSPPVMATQQRVHSMLVEKIANWPAYARFIDREKASVRYQRRAREQLGRLRPLPRYKKAQAAGA